MLDNYTVATVAYFVNKLQYRFLTRGQKRQEISEIGKWVKE